MLGLLYSTGKLIIATSKEIHMLVPLPLERQIQDLLASRRVEEALVLAKGARRNIPKDKFQVSRTSSENWKFYSVNRKDQALNSCL